MKSKRCGKGLCRCRCIGCKGKALGASVVAPERMQLDELPNITFGNFGDSLPEMRVKFTGASVSIDEGSIVPKDCTSISFGSFEAVSIQSFNEQKQTSTIAFEDSAESQALEALEILQEEARSLKEDEMFQELETLGDLQEGQLLERPLFHPAPPSGPVPPLGPITAPTPATTPTTTA